MISCIAIDDEPLALMQLSGYIEKTPFLTLTASCRSALDALEVLSQKEADILFVDINMPDLNGLDFVRSLSVRPLIIFTTAYSEYAIDGFRVDAFDYLLKPIDYAAFLRSAEKAQQQYMLLKNNNRAPSTSKSIFVKSEYKTLSIELDKIIYIESRSEYVRIFTETRKPIMTLGSLKSFEEKLPPEMFMRIHRSYIINLEKIVSVERKYIVIGDNFSIAIGEIYEKNFRDYLNQNLLG